MAWGESVSLRALLVLSIAAVFLAGLTVGGFLIYSDAVHELETEISGAISVGKRMVLNVADDFEATGDRRRQLQSLVADFDDDLNLRVSLVDSSGQLLAASRPFVSTP